MISFMMRLPSTMLSLLTLRSGTSRLTETRTNVEEEEVCPANSSSSFSPLGTCRELKIEMTRKSKVKT